MPPKACRNFQLAATTQKPFSAQQSRSKMLEDSIKTSTRTKAKFIKTTSFLNLPRLNQLKEDGQRPEATIGRTSELSTL